MESFTKQKKHKGGYIINLLIVAVLIAITFYILFSKHGNLNIKSFIFFFKKLRPEFIVLSVLCTALFIFFEGLSIKYICGKLGSKVKVHKSVIYSAIDIYYSAITPSATGGQPLAGYFMVKDGVPVAQTSIALLFNTLMYMISMVLLGSVAFVLRPNYFFGFSVGGRIFVLVGLVIHLAAIFLFVALIRCPKIVFTLLKWALKVGAFFHIVKNENSKYETVSSSLANYRQLVDVIKGKPKTAFVALSLNLLQRIAILSIPFLVYRGVGFTTASYIDVTVLQAICLIGSYSIPVPGGIGLAEYLFMGSFCMFFSEKALMPALIVTRGVSFYGCLIFCGVVSLLYQIYTSCKKTRVD